MKASEVLLRRVLKASEVLLRRVLKASEVLLRRVLKGDMKGAMKGQTRRAISPFITSLH